MYRLVYCQQCASRTTSPELRIPRTRISSSSGRDDIPPLDTLWEYARPLYVEINQNTRTLHINDIPCPVLSIQNCTWYYLAGYQEDYAFQLERVTWIDRYNIYIRTSSGYTLIAPCFFFTDPISLPLRIKYFISRLLCC